MGCGVMPKERIVKNPSDPRGVARALSVRWSKGGAEPACNSPLSLAPLVVTFDSIASITPPGDSIAFLFALDRADCNRLIRSLRKARDDVFGRNE